MKTFLKKTIALACFAMLMPLSLLAQDVLKVHGIVTDPSGEPLNFSCSFCSSLYVCINK